MRLHPTLYLVIVEIPPFMNERLTYLVVGSIVQVLGLECCFVNHGKTRVIAIDDMLFDQLHDAPLLSRLLSYCALATNAKRCASEKLIPSSLHVRPRAPHVPNPFLST